MVHFKTCNRQRGEKIKHFKIILVFIFVCLLFLFLNCNFKKSLPQIFNWKHLHHHLLVFQSPSVIHECSTVKFVKLNRPLSPTFPRASKHILIHFTVTLISFKPQWAREWTFIVWRFPHRPMKHFPQGAVKSTSAEREQGSSLWWWPLLAYWLGLAKCWDCEYYQSHRELGYKALSKECVCVCVCSHSHLVYTHGEQFSLRMSEIQHRSQVILITHTVVPVSTLSEWWKTLQNTWAMQTVSVNFCIFCQTATGWTDCGSGVCCLSRHTEFSDTWYMLINHSYSPSSEVSHFKWKSPVKCVTSILLHYFSSFWFYVLTGHMVTAWWWLLNVNFFGPFHNILLRLKQIVAFKLVPLMVIPVAFLLPPIGKHNHTGTIIPCKPISILSILCIKQKLQIWFSFLHKR